MPAVFWIDIHKNPVMFHSVFVIPMLVQRHSQVHRMLSLDHQHIPKLITINLMDIVYP